MPQHPLGQIVIQRIVESICTAFDPLSFFPETRPDDWARHRTWMEPRALDPISGNIVLTVHGFLVRTRHHTILIDTCVGDHKNLPHRPHWHKQKFNTFLPCLAAAGVAAEEVDYVMCTHLHWDHVGWNTQLRDGRWVPTFPKARYIFAQGEWEAWEALHRKDPPHLVDSIVPVIEAHQAQFVRNDFALDDEVWLEPTPGHTPEHVSVRLASQGAQAVITGIGWHSRFGPGILGRCARKVRIVLACSARYRTKLMGGQEYDGQSLRRCTADVGLTNRSLARGGIFRCPLGKQRLCPA